MNTLIMWGTLLLQIAVVAGTIFLLVRPHHRLSLLIGSRAVALAFLVVFFASAGSFYYSHVMGFVPCSLCWYQRMLIVPQVLLLGFAAYKNDKGAAVYSALFSWVGIAIALYHVFIIPRLGNSYVCAPGEVSCLTNYVTGFGYITIPVMSLTVFAALLLLWAFQRRFSAVVQ